MCGGYEMVNITYNKTVHGLKAGIRVSLYLALGDSITAGYSVGSAFSFPTVYGNYLRRHNTDLSVHNAGVDGLTTPGLLRLLWCDCNLRHLVARASLITITIGSNDLLQLIRTCQPSTITTQLPVILGKMGNTLAHIGELLRQLNPRAIVKVATLYNPLPAGPYAQYVLPIQGAIDTANALVIAWGKRYGFVVVSIDRELRGKERSLIGQDFAHPNATGYRVIAKAFARS